MILLLLLLLLLFYLDRHFRTLALSIEPVVADLASPFHYRHYYYSRTYDNNNGNSSSELACEDVLKSEGPSAQSKN